MSLTTDASRSKAQPVWLPWRSGSIDMVTTTGPATPAAPLWTWAAVASTPSGDGENQSKHRVFLSDVGYTSLAPEMPLWPGPGTSFSGRRMASLAVSWVADTAMSPWVHA